MSDVEHLIIAVENYPCLWDPSTEDYHNRDCKDLAWQAISKELYDDFDTFDAIKQKSICNSLKKKWTYIRNYYRKDQQRINNTPSGSGAKSVKKAYAYAPFLDFLKPTFKKRQTQGNYTENEENNPNIQNEPDDLEPGSSNQSLDLEASVQQNEDVILKASETTSNRAKTSTKQKKDIPQQILNILERLNAPQPTSTEAPVEDDDVKFLLSFRGDMSRMTTSQKFDFKIEIIQMVKRIINNSESSYSRPSTTSRNSNPGIYYISSPSPSPNSYAQAPSQSSLRKNDHRESPYCRATIQYRSSNAGTSTSSESFVQAPMTTFVQLPQTAEENSAMDNTVYNYQDSSQVLVLNLQEQDNSQMVAHSQEPIETYLSFAEKKNS